jgi:hypothetical protein
MIIILFHTIAQNKIWKPILAKNPFNRSFAYGFYFAELIASKAVKIGFSRISDPAETENEV